MSEHPGLIQSQAFAAANQVLIQTGTRSPKMARRSLHQEALTPLWLPLGDMLTDNSPCVFSRLHYISMNDQGGNHNCSREVCHPA